MRSERNPVAGRVSDEYGTLLSDTWHEICPLRERAGDIGTVIHEHKRALVSAAVIHRYKRARGTVRHRHERACGTALGRQATRNGGTCPMGMRGHET